MPEWCWIVLTLVAAPSVFIVAIMLANLMGAVADHRKAQAQSVLVHSGLILLPTFDPRDDS